MNLIFALLVTRQFLSKDQIREAIPGYRDATSRDAFERMFERDKEELRELGIAVETGSNDSYFADEPGYRISRADAELPDLDLTREEAAVIGLAAQVWEHAGLASTATSALTKLKAAGLEVDTDVLRMAEPRLSGDEPAFDAIWQAVTRRIPIEFCYRRPGGEAARRRVEPWGIISRRGRWYLVGHDLDRADRRVFRLSRIEGEAEHAGEPGAFTVPQDVDLTDVASALMPAAPDRTAVLRITHGRGLHLRRDAVEVVDRGDGTDTVHVPFSSSWDVAAEIASYGPDVVVLEPADLRDEVVRRLRAAVAESEEGATSS